MPEDKKKIITTENLSTVREINDLLYQGKLTAGEGINLEDNNISVKEALRINIEWDYINLFNFEPGSDEWNTLIAEVKAARDIPGGYKRDIIIYNLEYQIPVRCKARFIYEDEKDVWGKDKDWSGSIHNYDVLTITADSSTIGELVITYDRDDGVYNIDSCGVYNDSFPFTPYNTVCFISDTSGNTEFYKAEDNLFIPGFIIDDFPLDIFSDDFEDSKNILISHRLRNLYNSIYHNYEDSGITYPVKVLVYQEDADSGKPSIPKVIKSYSGILSAGEFSKDVINFEVATAAGVYNIAFTYPEEH